MSVDIKFGVLEPGETQNIVVSLDLKLISHMKNFESKLVLDMVETNCSKDDPSIISKNIVEFQQKNKFTGKNKEIKVILKNQSEWTPENEISLLDYKDKVNKLEKAKRMILGEDIMSINTSVSTISRPISLKSDTTLF